jgi:cytochrome c551/c552
VKRALLCATLALLAGHGRADNNVAPVAIYTVFENAPSQAVIDSLRTEVNSLLDPLKFPIEWRQMSKEDIEASAVQLAVVHFKGVCDVNDSAFERKGEGPLAWTHISDGIILPFADVDCFRVHEVLDKRLPMVDATQREAVFGRALGRVVTHELYHIFTGTKHHGSDDVAHPVYTTTDLMTDKFRFGAKELTTLRRSLTPVLRALRVSRGVPLKSAQNGKVLFESGACIACHGNQAEGKGVAPALRVHGQQVDSKTFAAKLAKDIGHMYRDGKRMFPPLNDDDIEDIVTYLNSLQ